MAGRSVLKELVYRLTADTSGVERGMDEADAAVESKMELIRRQKAIIKLQGDSSDLDRELRAARLKVDRLKKDKASIGIDADTSGLERGIALAEAEVASLRRQKAEIKVELDQQGRAYQSARRLTSQVSDLNKEVEQADNLFERWGKRITGTRVNLGPFTTNLRTLTGLLVTLGPILSGVIGSVVALGGSLAEAAAGGIAVASAGFAGLALSAGGAVLALKPLATQFKEVSTAQAALTTAQEKYGKSSDQAKTAQQELDKSLKAMPPHLREIETRWTALKQSFSSRTGSIRSDAVSVINDALKTAHTLLPAFARQASLTFHVASMGLHQWLDGLRSPETQHILNEIMMNFRRALPDLLKGTGDFATGIARITAAASHFLPSFTRGFAGIASDFEHGTENANNLQRTIGGLVDQTRSWFGLLGATGRLLTTILTGGASSGQKMIEDLTKTLNDWNRALQTTAGQRSMQSFFKDSVSTTEQFAGVLRRTVTLLFALSRATQPFATGALDVANALGDIVTAITKLTPLRSILVGVGAAMATAFVVTKIIAFVRVLGEIPTAIREVVGAFRAGEIAINPLLGLLSLGAGALAALAFQAGSSKSALQQMNAEQRRAKSQAEAATRAVRDERDAYQSLKSAALDLASAHVQVAQARLQLHSATQRADNAEKQYGKDSQQYKKAHLDQREAAIQLKYALGQVHDATRQEADDAKKVQRTYAQQIDKRKQSIGTLKTERQQIQDQIGTDKHLISLYGEQNARLDDGSSASQNLAQMQQRLRQNTQDLNTQQGKLNQTLQNGSKQFNFMQGRTQDSSRAQDAASQKSGHLSGSLRTLIQTLQHVGQTTHGMGQLMGAVTNKILGAFGAKQLHFSLPNVGSLIGGLFQEGGVVGEQKRATGGFIVPGHGTGDSFRTLMPPGSFILNRNATAAMGFQSGGAMPVALEPGELALGPGAASAFGYGALHALNSAIPRFARGGMPGTVGGASTAGAHPEIVALAQQLVQRFGGYISTFKQGHSTTTTSGNISNHALGLAADFIPDDWMGASRYVNSIGNQLLEGIHAAPPGSNVSWKDGQAVPPSFWGSATWAEHHSHIHVATASAIKSLAAKIKKIAVQGPPGPLRDALQGQADMLRNVANAYIRRHMPQEGPEGRSFGSFKGQSVRGKVSWFTGGSTAGGGNASTDAGIAVNLNPGTDAGWNNPTTQHWMQMARAGHPEIAGVTIQGHSAALPIIDLGPAGFTGRAIDVTGPGVRRLGMSTASFPTDAIGTAKMKQRGGFVGMQKGGIPHHQHLSLPPKPRGKPSKDFSTDPGSWYDWFGRAIDFYDTRGDTRNDAYKLPEARADWRHALRDILNEEKQVKDIIKHEKHRLHRLRRKEHDLPKHIRKMKPKHHHFRGRKKGESSKDYHDAKKQWRSQWTAYNQAVKDYQKNIHQRRKEQASALPDLFQQLRVDLPTRYNEIRDKITGQAADIGLEQTASGQERYQALLEFGGNFAPLGFGVGATGSRYGASGFAMGGTGAGSGVGLGTGLTPGVVPGGGVKPPPSHGGPGSRAALSGGPTTIDNSKTIHITQRYEREPKDPHTWSATMRHELGAMT